MTPAAAARSIETALAAGWGTTTPIAWPDVPFTPPATAWLKIDFVWGMGNVITKDGLNSVQGLLQLAIFAPKDDGDGPLYTLAEIARALFNRVRMGDVMFGAMSGPVGQYEESWRALVSSVPFRVDELVS